MDRQWLKAAALFAFVILLIAVLALLTLPDEEDPCDNPQADISGAVLADQEGDQDALANRAILMRGKCEKRNSSSEENSGDNREQ